MTNQALYKQESIVHEEIVAGLYGGTRSKSSGASIRDKFDVQSYRTHFECKSSGRPGEPKASRLVTLLEKAADAAYEVGKEGAIAQRIYNPSSPLANRDGYVYLVTRLMRNDATLEASCCSCNGDCSCSRNNIH